MTGLDLMNVRHNGAGVGEPGQNGVGHGSFENGDDRARGEGNFLRHCRASGEEQDS